MISRRSACGGASRQGGRQRPGKAGSAVALGWAICLTIAAPAALAQMSPVGLWRSIDDRSGEARAEIRITELAGVVTGRIERRVAKESRPGEVCEECRDERRGKPLDGMEIIRNARKAQDGEAWEGGRILDPESGREYTLRLAPIDGGQKLQVRGYIGPFFRTQTWVRVQ